MRVIVQLVLLVILLVGVVALMVFKPSVDLHPTPYVIVGGVWFVAAVMAFGHRTHYE